MKKTHPQSPEDVLKALIAAEAAELEKSVGDYNLLCNTMAAGDVPDIDFVQRTLRAAGRTPADLAKHIAVLRPLVNGGLRGAQEQLAQATEELQAIGAARTAINERLGTKQPDDACKRELDGLSRRALQVRRKIDAARKRIAEHEHRQAALRAELRGEPEPAATTAPEFSFEQTALRSNAPEGFDARDAEWQRQYDERGNISYYHRGKRVESA